ncbi:MAG TPA: AraC family transcriptional regulator [Xanthomonadaceae bacterium]|nr:AraC family transcriptional regulator [Xanthomonadaceae bacterium]
MNSPAASPAAGALAAWQGRVVLGHGWAAFDGYAGNTRPHAHHALQLVLATEGKVVVSLPGRATLRTPGMLIDADVVHAVAANSAPMRILFVDRESGAGRRLACACGPGYRLLDADQRDALLSDWPRSEASHAEVALRPLLIRLRCPAGGAQPAAVRSAAERVARIIESLPGRTSLDLDQRALAAEAALSPSRFAHLFKAHTGMPIRPYLRWLRLHRALAATARGAMLTESAHAAGFSDAAHFTRTMRRHFGVAPSQVIGALRAG